MPPTTAISFRAHKLAAELCQDMKSMLTARGIPEFFLLPSEITNAHSLLRGLAADKRDLLLVPTSRLRLTASNVQNGSRRAYRES